MDTTLALYKHLKTHMPDMGIVLDCCTKPSHDLGRQDYFNAMLGEMKHWLVEQGVTAVMAVCPNCYKVFKKYGSPLTVISVYEFLAENGLPSIDLNHANCCDSSTIAAIHDPCVLRYEPDIQQAVRQLAVSRHFTLEEMPHSKNKTVCCGEGGTVEAVTPEFSRIWRSIRKAEAGNRHLLTYCAGCAVLLNKQTPTDHILDAMFYPRAVAAGKRKVTSPPFTYWNRIRLKRHIQKHYPDPVTRERRFQPEPVTAGSKIGKLLKFLLSGFER
jgi:Fe-S oxidoreductase